MVSLTRKINKILALQLSRSCTEFWSRQEPRRSVLRLKLTRGRRPVPGQVPPGNHFDDSALILQSRHLYIERPSVVTVATPLHCVRHQCGNDHGAACPWPHSGWACGHGGAPKTPQVFGS